MTCDYCKTSILEGKMKCANCGAPISSDGSALPDFRSCPMCHRKLLALGSPTCSYCGRRLPDEYIRVREADLRRIIEVEEMEEKNEPGGGVGELFSEKRRRKRNESSSTLGLDITSLVDFFS